MKCSRLVLYAQDSGCTSQESLTRTLCWDSIHLSVKDWCRLDIYVKYIVMFYLYALVLC